MPYINVDEAYILDNTGLQVDQVVDLPYTDALFSDTQKEQARKNIAAGGSNANLLDNPWFGSDEIINQRGATSGNTTVGPYFIDRWQTDYTGTGGASGTYSVGSTGITFAQTGTAFGGFRQSLGMPLTDGATYTVSIKYADGTIETATRQLSLSSNTYFINSDTVLIMRLSSSGVWRFLFGGTVTIRAVKLELGSVSTLANDVPPKPKAELDECHWYCRVLRGIAGSYVAVGRAMSATNARFCLPYSMRAKPSVAFSGTIKINGANAVTAISVDGQSTDCVELSVTSSGMTIGDPVLLLLDADAQITLSADL